jgi:hypothetical protein
VDLSEPTNDGLVLHDFARPGTQAQVQPGDLGGFSDLFARHTRGLASGKFASGNRCLHG